MSVNNHYTDLLPFGDYSEHNVIGWYSLDTTGVGGRFVQLITGATLAADADPIALSSSTPGYNFNKVTNLRWENPQKVTHISSGATKFSTLGILREGTIETDINGQKVLFHPEVQKDNMIVPSGTSVNIITDGMVRIKASAYTGNAVAGYVVVPHNTEPGKVALVDRATVSNTDTILGKVLRSGAGLGGYADIVLTLK